MESLLINLLDQDSKETLFRSLLSSTQRPGVENVLSWLFEKTDFKTAPSTRNNAGNFEGGLMTHSLKTYEVAGGLYENLISIKPDLGTKISMTNIMVVSLLHSVCKCGFYKQVNKWRKTEDNQWERYVAYDVEDKFPFGAGEKSVYILEHLGFRLEPQEVIAIRWFMGSWDGGMLNYETKMSYESSLSQYPLVSILSAANIVSSVILETKVE